MKLINKLSLYLILSFTLLGCQAIVNMYAFHPNTVNTIAEDKLPNGVKEVIINTQDNVKITSLFIPSNKSSKLLIYFHGNGGNIYSRLPSLLHINKFNINVLGVSYRGYGKSAGQPSEEGIYLDGKAALQYAIKELGFSENNIIIFGRSLGTTVAINIAQNKNIAGVILVTPLTSGKEEAKAVGLGFASSLAGNSFNNISKIENIVSPLLVIHGTNDKVVPFSMGKSIYNRAKVKKEFVKIEGGNHNNLHDDFGQKYWPPIIQFTKNI